MSLKSAELQEQINELDQLIQNGVMEDGSRASDNQFNMWEMTRADKKKEQAEVLIVEANQQSLQERVEQAKETGYILDKIEIDGLPAIAFSHTPENHELLAIAVQKWALEQQDAFNKTISNMEYELTQERILNNDLTSDVEKLERDNSQLALELKYAELSRDNAAKIIAEKDEEIKRLQDKQNNAEAVPVAALSEEEKEKNLMVEVMGKQIKVVNVEPINPDAFTNKMFKATNAVTGAYVEDYYIYLSLIGENKPKRYEEVKEEVAEQLRTEYANKKAEQDALQAAIPTLEVPDVPPVNDVVLKDEAAEIQPFPESNQVDANANGENTAGEGNGTVDEVVAKESEMNYSDIIPFTRHHDAMIVGLEEMVKELTYRMDQHESKQAVA